MLVVEKVFGIKLKDDSEAEDLCTALSMTNCYDKKNYKRDNGLPCFKCEFYHKDGKCSSRIYDWLMSEYKEDMEDGCEG